MKKAFVIIIVAVLLLWVSGCGTNPEAQNAEISSTPDTQISTPDAEAAPTKDAGFSITKDAHDALTTANASSIATGINAYNALNPENVLPDDVTLEQAKKALDVLWPSFLTDAEAREAWELIVIMDGEAKVKE